MCTPMFIAALFIIAHYSFNHENSTHEVLLDKILRGGAKSGFYDISWLWENGPLCVESIVRLEVLQVVTLSPTPLFGETHGMA